MRFKRWFYVVPLRVRSLFRRNDVDRELDEELRYHIERQIELNIDRGMTPDEARTAALRAMGGVEQRKEECRDWRGMSFVANAIRDLRYALRTLGRSPGFTLVAVLTLSIGMGATTAMFSLVNGILLRPLPYPESDRLVVVKHSAPGLGVEERGLSSGTYFHYATYAGSLDALAVYTEGVRNLGSDGEGTERVHVTLAGPELFDVLSVKPALGRLFTKEDGLPGFMDTRWTIPVLLSHDFWRSRYGADPGVIGRVITLNEVPRVVIGVLPEGFAFPRPETQIWLLHQPPRESARFASGLDYSAIARLRRNVTPAAAAADLVSILPRIEGVYPDATPERLAKVQLTPIVVPLRDDVIGSAGTILWVLFGGMAFLLLVACANVATLFLVRAEHRDREIAVRTALGAGRADIARLLFGEAFVLAAGGAVLGWLIAGWAVTGLVVFVPLELPRLHEVRLDWTALAFTHAVATLGALFFGGLSLRRRSQPAAVARGLAGGRRTATTGRGPKLVRDGLVAAQVALALALLAGSALMVQSYWRLTRVDPGFAPAGVLTIEVGLPYNKANQHRAIYDELLEEVRALPGVRSATAASFVPLAGAEHVFPIRPAEPGRPPVDVETPLPLKFIMPGYFQTMGTRVLEGAQFGWDDVIELPQPVWVSAALARRLFPGESAIGRQVRRLEADGREVTMFDLPTRTSQAVPPFTIAGVVADVVEESLRGGPTETVYIPVIEPAVERSIVPINMTLVIRADVPPLSVAAAVRRVIHDVDPALSVARVRTLTAIVAASTARETFLALLLLVGAAASLFLGAIGVYSVVAHAVRRRTREIGVRMALGARAGHVAGMVLREAMAVVLVGAALGLAAALMATRALRSFLFGVGPTDPVTLAAVTGLLCGVALLAALLPSRRAARIDPVVALQAD